MWRTSLLLALSLLTTSCDLRPLTANGDAGADASDGDGDHDLAGGDLPLLPDMAGPGCPGGVHSVAVDPGSHGGRFSAIAVDRQSGALHILHYREVPGNDALYSTRPAPGAGWSTAELMTAGDVGGHGSIVVAPGGTVHALFADLTQVGLVHAIRGPPSGSWTTQAVADTAPNESDLAVDQAGFLHLLAYNRKGDALVYRRWNAAAQSWEPAITVDTNLPFSERRGAIGVGSQGVVHLCYGNKDGELVYRTLQGAQLSLPQVLAQGLSELGADLAVAADGDVHLIYNDAAAKELRYLGQLDGTFGAAESLGAISAMAAGRLASHAAIVADGDDLWVAYGDATSALTVRRRRGDGSWEAPLHPGVCCGSNLGAAVDQAGVLHISHWSPATDELRYTRVCP